MKQLLIIILSASSLCACKKEVVEPIAKLSELQLVDSVAYVDNCQLVIYRTYYKYLNGKPFQVYHTKEVKGEPCKGNNPITNY